MKRFVLGFIQRGFVACGFGPIVLAVLYLILQKTADLSVLAVNEVILSIFTLTALAFIAGGMNAIYQIERLPLMLAILIHGCTLYVCYLTTYLINGWLDRGTTPFLVFSGIFIVGYLIIWLIIYCISKQNTSKLNEMLKKKQEIDKIN